MLSTREWKPGDVAMVGDDYEQRRAIVRPRRGANGALEFVYVSGGFDMVGDLADGWSARPLVVIDPEDREQVARLRDEYEAYRPSSTDLTAHMQAALRSLIAPPKPPEPTGLGAVVEDALGVPWVKVPGDMGTAATWVCEHSAEASWDDVEAVKVLSEGVTP